jgi:DNA-directed RNA polymerase subunit E'/Rpb7
MTSELVNPFIIKELTTRLSLFPDQMDNNIYLNLKKNLKKKYQGICIEYGYIDNIIRICDYSNGYIDPENSSGNAIFTVKYIANICVPIVKTTIIVKVENFNKILILGINGPLYAMIKVSDINPNIFTFKNSNIYINTLNRNLQIGDYIKILINAKKFNSGDDKIGILAFLQDIASDEEVEKYVSNNINLEEIEAINKETSMVEFNEDPEIVNKNEITYTIE